MPPTWHYATGEPLAVGDRVGYCGSPGLVVFVVEDDAFAAGYPKDEWSYLGSGIGLATEHFGLVVTSHPDEELELRGKAVPG